MIEWISHLGTATLYIVYVLIIFAESGLLIGMILPGDSLLFTVGILAASGHLSILVLLVAGSLAAILGDQVGYRFGYVWGEQALTNPKYQRFIKPDHVEKTKAYYAKYGPLTLVLARFTPFARTLAPILAGIGKMKYSIFARYNMLGGILWVCTVTLFGYFLGNQVDNPELFILPILASIVLASVLPALIAYWRGKRKKKRA